MTLQLPGPHLLPLCLLQGLHPLLNFSISSLSGLKMRLSTPGHLRCLQNVVNIATPCFIPIPLVALPSIFQPPLYISFFLFFPDLIPFVSFSPIAIVAYSTHLPITLHPHLYSHHSPDFVPPSPLLLSFLPLYFNQSAEGSWSFPSVDAAWHTGFLYQFVFRSLYGFSWFGAIDRKASQNTARVHLLNSLKLAIGIFWLCNWRSL